MLTKQGLSRHSIPEQFDVKVCEFSQALEKYNSSSFYIAFETVIAMIVVILQVFGVVNVLQTFHFQNGGLFIFSILIAYVAADFFNGLVHMIVDNNTNYTSLVGPYIAAFHLHHYKLKYTEKHPLKIYFTESSHKLWLGIYSIILTFFQLFSPLEATVNLSLVVFGILSSIAELSHYWCHNPPKNNALISFLQRYHILLSFKHHRLHHKNDNMNYAFLNGISDPLLNVIARNFYKGYKNHSDAHVATYIKQQMGLIPTP